MTDKLEVFVLGRHESKGWELTHVIARRNVTPPPGADPVEMHFEPQPGETWALIRLPGNPTPGVYDVSELSQLLNPQENES